MSIDIPIISSFDSKGIKSAIKQFKQLETTSDKAQFVIKKAAIPAAAALASLATAATLSVKAAIADQQAQALLARQLVASTGATDEVVKSVEKFIEGLGRSVAITDDEARPALANLVLATNDVAKAQELMAIAIDTAAATGRPLADVTEAMSRGFAGNTKGLKALSPELSLLIKDGATAAEVFAILERNFGGAGKVAANTTAGQLKTLQIAINETKESIGASLLPALEAVLPSLQKFGKFAQENPDKFKDAALGIGAMAGSITVLNFVLGLNPFVRLAAGVVLLQTAVNKLADATSKLKGLPGLLAKIAGSLALPGFAAQLVVNLFKKSGDDAVEASVKIGDSLARSKAAIEGQERAFGQVIKTTKTNTEATDKQTAADTRAADALAAKKKAIEDYLVAYKGYADSISGTITGLASLSAAQAKSAESDGKIGIGQAFYKQVAQAKHFARNLKRLITDFGLSQAGVSQLLNLGPEAGLAVTDDMILGVGQLTVGGLNNALQDLSDVSAGLGGAAAGAFMTKGNGGNAVNITVNAGVGDPVAIGKSVVDALTAYKARTGSLAGVLGF